MKLTLTPNFEKDFIKKNIGAFLVNLEKALILRLQRVGEAFIANCRNNGNYKDQTGNLRGSVGYVILRNGKALYEGGFVPVKGSKEGSVRGHKVLEIIAKQYPQGFVLIGCCGMEYGIFVESRGYNVITLGAFEAKAELEAGIKTLNQKIS